MFDNWFSKDSNDAISILKRDHDAVQDLFDRFEKSGNRLERFKIIADTLEEIKIHTVLEEEIFYPAVRDRLASDVMTEADQEHHVAKLLIGEIEKMTGNEDHYEAKFTVLAENLRHHIKEEESDMLPKARKLPIDLNALGERMLERKDELRRRGVPVTAEERKADPRADSSARAAGEETGAPKTRTAGD